MTIRPFAGNRLIIASHNPGKVREIDELLGPFGVDVTGAADLDLPEPEETGDTFTDNAMIKARASARASGCPALSDDSGLCVDVLDGAPGIFSARWAGPEKDFGLAMQRVRDAAGGFDVRKTAHFVCALALCWPDGHGETFEGYVHGHLVWPPRGDRGFGYDPIFVPDGRHQTFGEMDPTQKAKISHRFDAFRKLADGCFRSS